MRASRGAMIPPAKLGVVKYIMLVCSVMASITYMYMYIKAMMR